ncbi:DUF1905 domain-containing protein [Flavobacterium flavipallidum]|uniref:DUF1905 domain-containing protein n=1 Tax=Flavobacterium flavipallidum TaxID=3139140 RepID=A0ABU9HQH1_9FLAO
MNAKIKYDFSAEVWQHKAPGGWYFISLPKNLAIEIRSALQSEEEGWGRLKAIAKTGKSEWKTAIWFDTKKNSYLLPLKAEIRKKENITAGKIIPITLSL